MKKKNSVICKGIILIGRLAEFLACAIVFLSPLDFPCMFIVGEGDIPQELLVLKEKHFSEIRYEKSSTN